MAHSHSRIDLAPTPTHVRRRLIAVVAPLVAATVAGVIVLWPPSDPLGTTAAPGGPTRTFSATVTEVEPVSCEAVARGTKLDCVDVTAEIRGGPDTGDTVTFTYAGTQASRGFEPGDRISLGRAPAAAPGASAPEYFFMDFERSIPLLILAVLFAVAVVTLSRWKGLAALGGLAISIVVLLEFILPAILAGSSPLAVAIVGAAAIMFPALYLAHGINARTTTAALGTLASLALTGLLAVVFVEAARFTGLSSEEAAFLQISADRINLHGLLLAGIIIGSLGVLDDVTITQASAVWELRLANRTMSARDLYRAAVRIGRDHIASTVNTLVLAYVGASLPLLILFTLSSRPLGSVITSEVIAEEIVRTLVGSIGLVASVPLTTAMASLVAGSASAHDEADEDGHPDFWAGR